MRNASQNFASNRRRLRIRIDIRPAERDYDMRRRSNWARSYGRGVREVSVRQGYFSISEPCKAFERLVIEHQIKHGGNPVMDWMMGNLMWKSRPDGNRKPTKENEISKIDGPVAAITALAVSLVTDPPPSGEQVYCSVW